MSDLFRNMQNVDLETDFDTLDEPVWDTVVRRIPLVLPFCHSPIAETRLEDSWSEIQSRDSAARRQAAVAERLGLVGPPVHLRGAVSAAAAQWGHRGVGPSVRADFHDHILRFDYRHCQYQTAWRHYVSLSTFLSSAMNTHPAAHSSNPCA